MENTSTPATNVMLKLLIDTKGRKVLYASLLLTDDPSVANKKVYLCANYHRHMTDDPKAVCPQCGGLMSTVVPYVAPAASAGSSVVGGRGYVKDVVTYMVMDNLEVKPMSTISCITMLNKFNVREVGSLEEKVVNLGMEEGLKLLKASLESNSVLTSVFLGKKEERTFALTCIRIKAPSRSRLLTWLKA